MSVILHLPIFQVTTPLDGQNVYAYNVHMSQILSDILKGIEGFEWDDGNTGKNAEKHKVLPQECEEAFYNPPIVFFDDDVHSQTEKRYGIYGETNAGRGLTVVFAIRHNNIRPISVRDQSKRERISYQAWKAVYFQRRKKGA